MAQRKSKFKVGDEVWIGNRKGVIIYISCGYYDVHFEGINCVSVITAGEQDLRKRANKRGG